MDSKLNKRRGIMILSLAGLFFAGQAPGGPPAQEATRPVSVLVLLGEWFGDAYFPLKDEIAARGWTMKRVGVDVEYRGCYNKKRDVVLRSDILIPDLKDFTGFDCLIIPSGPQFRKFKDNQVVLKFVRDAHAAGLVVASFCVGNNTVRDAGLIDVAYGPDLFPAKVTRVKERILIGPRGGGPPPGDGFESAPIKEICDAVARELAAKKPPSPTRLSEGKFQAPAWEARVNQRQPPELVLKAIGLKPGLIVGEVGQYLRSQETLRTGTDSKRKTS